MKKMCKVLCIVLVCTFAFVLLFAVPCGANVVSSEYNQEKCYMNPFYSSVYWYSSTSDLVTYISRYCNVVGSPIETISDDSYFQYEVLNEIPHGQNIRELAEVVGSSSGMFLQITRSDISNRSRYCAYRVFPQLLDVRGLWYQPYAWDFLPYIVIYTYEPDFSTVDFTPDYFFEHSVPDIYFTLVNDRGETYSSYRTGEDVSVTYSYSGNTIKMYCNICHSIEFGSDPFFNSSYYYIENIFVNTLGISYSLPVEYQPYRTGVVIPLVENNDNVVNDTFRYDFNYPPYERFLASYISRVFDAFSDMFKVEIFNGITIYSILLVGCLIPITVTVVRKL